ncbi:MAG: hypothetical protein ABIT58_01665 [Ferruginibacter sp.]
MIKIKKIRSSILVYLTHKIALPVLKIIRRPEVFPYTIEKLREFPADTLGNELYLFLKERKLPLLPHYARHDIKHVILGYDTTDDGDVCLQCFMSGNRHVSFPVLITLIFGIATMPGHFKKFRKAFHRGRRSDPISNWEWFEILSVTSVELRRQVSKN